MYLFDLSSRYCIIVTRWHCFGLRIKLTALIRFNSSLADGSVGSSLLSALLKPNLPGVGRLSSHTLPHSSPCRHTLMRHMKHLQYRIAGKVGEDFNLAIWRIVKKSAN